MRIGIDLGGTKIECAALDPGGSIIYRRRVATPRHDYAATLATVSRLVSDCEHETGRTGSVGIGHPGATSPATGLIKNANSTWLNNRPLREDLERLLGRPLRLANDANCFALSEASDGAGTGAPVVFGVIIGTGTGGGVVVDGKILTGPNAIAGEWGHNPLPWPKPEELPGPACYCGRSGCIETFLSGPGLARDHAANSPPPGTLLDAPAVAALAQEGDPVAGAAIGRYLERMSRALATVINLLDPDVIVLGGGMSNLERLYEDVPRLWGNWTFSDRVDTQLRRAMHGDSSGVRGAAWLWDDPEA
jgi:fructokinase